MSFCEFYKTFKNTYFMEHLRTTAFILNTPLGAFS